MAGAGDGSIIAAVIFGRSSIVGRALVAALLSDGRFTVRVVDPLPAPDPTPSISSFFQTGRVSYHHVDIRHQSPSLLTAFAGVSTVFHVDPTITALQPLSARYSDFQSVHLLLVQSSRNVIKSCWESGVHRIVYIGSADVVIDNANEVSCWDESAEYPERFVDSLNELRAQVEAMVLWANREDGLLTCALRVSNPFGPGDDSLVPLLVQRAKERWAKFIIGNGKNSWDFTYVENVAHASICAEQALRLRTPYVAGRPFFITNQKPMKFWDFLSNILEGLGYQRPTIHIPVNVVLAIVEIVRFFRTSNSVTATILRSFTDTRTFDCSNAERVIGYSPIVSIEDGITLTIASFSQLAKGSPNYDGQDLTKLSKAEKLLGSQSVADILLWRDDKRTFTCLLVLFLLYYWFFLSERTFISSVAKLLMLFSLVLYFHGALPSSMFGFSIEKIPSSCFELPEMALRKPFITVASLWNLSISVLVTVARGEDWVLLLKVSTCINPRAPCVRKIIKKTSSVRSIQIHAAGFVYLFKLLLMFSSPTVGAAGLVGLFSFFIVYEQCEKEIDNLVAAGAGGLDKIKGVLAAKLPCSMLKFR